MNLRDLKLRARALLAPRRTERDLDDELAFHLERETRKLLDQGLSPAEARARALTRFGPVPLAADECRDARGTAFVDNTIRDIQYAFRTFRREPLAALTIVTTVALGLGLVAAVFTVLNVLLFRVDAVPNVHEMFAVGRPETASGERARFTRAQFDALRRETSVFTDAYAEMSTDTRLDWRRLSCSLVTGNFFQVLRVRAALGRTLLPEDDERLAARPVMVLSHRGWDRLFGSDPSVIGRRLLVSGISHEIIGVMPDGFRGLGIGAPDYWAPLSLINQVSPDAAKNGDDVDVGIVGRLEPGLSPQTALAALAVWDASQPKTGDTSDRSTNITLLPKQGTMEPSAEVLLVFSPLFFAFGLILLTGCANVANLLLGRAVSRQREVGIRLSLGASRSRIIRQLLTESLLLALTAAAAGFAISRVVLDATIHTLMTSVPPDLGDIWLWVPGADWRVVLFLAGAAVVSTALFGVAPALQATRVAPVRIIRGQLMGDARPARARNLLIAIQVSASALLLICSAVFLRSAYSAATVDLGFRTTDTAIIQIVNEAKRQAMVRAVTTEPVVAAVAASWPEAIAPPREGFAEINGRTAAVGYMFASPEYFSVLDIPVLRGRGFTATERAPHAGVAVVSESTARELWPRTDAVGQVLQLDAAPASGGSGGSGASGAPNSGTSPLGTPLSSEPSLSTRTFTVVGVVRDVPGSRLMRSRQVGVYLPIDAAAPGTSLIVRVNGDPELARRTLIERLSLIDPHMWQITTMRTIARMETYFLQTGYWSTLVLGGLALVLTLSGLFSVLSYVVEQRRKEIGVRMALGATAHNVTRMVLSQSIRPVGAGLLIGGSMAVGLALVLRATPYASVIGEIVKVLDPAAYAVSLAGIVAACALAALVPARRAARINPIDTLRQD